MHAPRAACPECRAPLARTGVEDYCTGCGLVVYEQIIEAGATHAPPRRTSIPHAWISHGLSGPSPRFARVGRCARGLAQGRHVLNRLAGELHVPSHVAADAFLHLRRLHREGRTQGRRIEATCAACLLEAARDRGVPRTVREIAAAAGVRTGELFAAHRALAQARGSRVLPVTPAGLLARIAAEADVPPRVESRARHILNDAGGRASGRRPEPVAAAALLLAARREAVPIQAARLARAAGVSRNALYQAVRALQADDLATCHDT